MEIYPKIQEEILEEYTKTSTRMTRINEQLYVEGWITIGSGAFATVFRHPKNEMVLKVYADEHYHEYYTRVCYGSDNPHHPKGLKPRFIIDGKPPIYMVLMEHLNRSTSRKTNYGSVSKLFYEYKPKRSQLFFDSPLFDTYPRLKEAFDNIIDLGYRTDIHAVNIMWRDDIPVFTDPVC